MIVSNPVACKPSVHTDKSIPVLWVMVINITANTIPMLPPTIARYTVPRRSLRIFLIYSFLLP